jgi:hypothetical protein
LKYPDFVLFVQFLGKLRFGGGVWMLRESGECKKEAAEYSINKNLNCNTKMGFFIF